ncbi:hypothetical protein [Pantoea sp. App145]|uniref:hypothetical protein n=1 Tax=Pantoea sp. App145 TaxID=3071567 RepID=UPI003A80943B
MDINPTLSVRPISASAMPAAIKRRKLASHLQIVQHAPAQPDSNTPVQRKTALRIMSEDTKNVCLKALMTDFATHWNNVPQVGSRQSQMENLLFQFERHEIGDLMGYQLREVLLLNEIKVSVSAAGDSLATVKAEVSAEEQLWFETYSKKNPLKQRRPATGWVRTMLNAEGCPRLRQPAMRRALLKIGVDVISTTLVVLLRDRKVVLSDKPKAQVKALWETLASEDCVISRLVKLLNMAEYQQLGLQDYQLQKALAVNDHVMKSALSVFNATINNAQQRWFDTWFTANRKKLSNQTTSGALVVLLCQGQRPSLGSGQLWLLLWKAGVTLGFGSVSLALSTATESMAVNLTDEQKKNIKESWDRHVQQGGRTLEKIMGLTMIECKINAAQLSFILSNAGVEVNPTSMYRAGLAARTPRPAQAVIEWATVAWEHIISKKRSPFPNQEKKFQVLEMLNLEGCPQALNGMSTPALLRLMWEIGADVCFITLSIVLDIIARQSTAATSDVTASSTVTTTTPQADNPWLSAAVPDEFGYREAHEWDGLIETEPTE